MFVIFIAILIILILFFVKKWKESPEQKGIEGEKEVHEVLSQLPDDYYVLDDVILKKGQGTTQIDHIVASTTIIC